MAMEKKYLIVNIGSTSKKYALYNEDEEVFYADFENGNPWLKMRIRGKDDEVMLLNKGYKNQLKQTLELLISHGLIESKKEIKTIAIRIVAPGTYFLKNKIMKKEYIKKLNKALEISPLHIKPVLDEIKIIKKELRDSKIIGISDSAFHSTIQEALKIYALPNKITKALEIYKYGYHGISVSSIISEVKKIQNSFPEKVIVCHLGGGSSITALKQEKSIANSLGFTPLEGLPGSTRIGDIDPAAVIYVASKLKLRSKELEKYLNFKCGLLGLAGTTDLREIIKEENKNKQAKNTLEFYTLQIKKHIGDQFALLNGLDLLVFSGAIGFGSPRVRYLVCKDMEALGIKLDEEKNKRKELFIHSEDSKVKIVVINTNEMQKMLNELKKIVK